MKLTLVEKHQETDGVKTFIFNPDTHIDWQPGQYMHYVLNHDNPDDRGTERWFTIASAPYEKHIQITTRFDGEQESSFKQALDALEPGGTIEADGPKGSFTLQPGGITHVFIAGGIGITPYRSMLAQFAHQGKMPRIELLYANRDDNYVFGEELEKLSGAYPSFKLRKFTDKRIEEADLRNYFADKNVIFYLSGPRGMVEAYEHLLDDLGFDKQSVMTDYFPGY